MRVNESMLYVIMLVSRKISIGKPVLFVYRNVLKIEGQSLNIITREEIRAKFEEKVNNSTVLSEKDKKELL